MEQQVRTFEEMFAHIAPTGVYLCEDLHTSYWRRWGGGYRRRASFIEYAKGLIDGLNAWHSHQPRRFKASDFTYSAHSMHFYDSVLVIEKRPMSEPVHHRKGAALFPDYRPPKAGLFARLRGVNQ